MTPTDITNISNLLDEEGDDLLQLIEERIQTAPKGKEGTGGFYSLTSDLLPLGDIGTEAPPRLSTGLGELDRLLGGGMVPGSRSAWPLHIPCRVMCRSQISRILQH